MSHTDHRAVSREYLCAQDFRRTICDCRECMRIAAGGFEPGHVVIPSQLFDFTKLRSSSFLN